MWNEIKYHAQVVKEYGDLPVVECLPSELNQVFMNLRVNAAHVIKTDGVITIRTGTQGEEIFVQVSDTGRGISPENMKRIFDPFFTTKPVGKGTWLVAVLRHHEKTPRTHRSTKRSGSWRYLYLLVTGQTEGS